jgi:serine/threonine-protein kinase
VPALPATLADHDVLLGVLALQLDFLDRDALVEAARNALGGASPKPLIDAIRRRGLLANDECDLLVALVDRHLARHDNDAQLCLASCDGSGEIRQLLTGRGNGAPPRDARLPTSAVETVGHDPHGADPHATRVDDDPFVTSPPSRGNSDVTLAPSDQPTAPYGEYAAEKARRAAFDSPLPISRDAVAAAGPAPLSTQAALRYRIIRPFQKGGLGQVSLARDEELNREVALKEILPKHADSDEARQRFLMEAEITGSLEHPGVVPVYGLGQYGDGRPFYAMRLIRGDNLQLAIDEYHRQQLAPDRELRFRQLLGRFVDVCNAIEYAHNRSVLHRDLKPGNIMLGKYGETLVVDWGLAKAIGAGAGPTDSVELPIRPASASTSTETQMGRVVGTPAYMSPEQAAGRVDMLGPATDIYSLGATLYHLLVGHAPFAHSERESLLGDVQTGVFERPREIHREVPKQLEAICLKAMALRPGDRYRSARELADDVERFLADERVHAHPETVVSRIGRWTRRHRGVVLTAGAALAAIAASLGIGVVLLNDANQRAEHNFEQARKAISDYYITVSEETLLDQPGMQPLRDKLLKQALEYYKQFLAAENRTDDKLLDELALANFYVGRITESIASPAEAIPYYRQAVRMSETLVAQAPNDERRLHDQARALNALGGSLQKLERFDESQRYYEQAEAVRKRLVEQHPENPEYVRTLANTIMNRGSIDAAGGDPNTGVKRWQEAQSLRTQHLRAGKEDPKLRADAGKGDFNLGLFQLREGDVTAALVHLEQAVASFERVRELAPDDLQSQYTLAVAYRTLGDLHAADASPDAAQALYAKAFELLTTLNLRNPQVADYQAMLGAMQTSVAELYLEGGKLDDALAAIDQAVAPLSKLVETDVDVLLYQRDLAVARRVRAEVLSQLDRRLEAAADARRSVDLLQSLVAADPTDDDYREQLETAQAVLESLLAEP